jgi:hypothetical protein
MADIPEYGNSTESIGFSKDEWHTIHMGMHHTPENDLELLK